MADHKQTKKRIRQTATRTERNRALRSRMRNAVKASENTMETGSAEEVTTSFTKAMSELHKAVTKGIMKKSTASRKISRLAARAKAAATASK